MQHTEQEIFDLEVSRLSFADLTALRDYAWTRPGTEWRALCAKLNEKLMDRAGAYLERMRRVEAEEAAAK